MSGSLSVQPGSLRNYSQQHGDVANAVSQVSSSTPEASAVSASYGNIASSVSTALGELLGARGGALTSTVSKAQQLADGLVNAAGLYEKSDEEGASAVNAASGQPSSQQSGTGSSTGTQSSTGSTGTQSSSGVSDSASSAGQMVSQMGQQVGQQMGQLAQAVAGLAAIPSQVLQGVEGIVESAMGASGDTAAIGADTASASGPVGSEPVPGDPEGETTDDPDPAVDANPDQPVPGTYEPPSIRV